ncbi:hypothetical protein B0H17DRAFT_1141896 [Mycena rosella]|uniref:Uncharacterized protein n=1 Tax=Mycena rosella TaxID=1033263 RepID=A0AAD7CYU4_MYCRO|nr:hypothetical protein B0H17DRAFT_1141896 [Mycena rosella]
MTRCSAVWHDTVVTVPDPFKIGQFTLLILLLSYFEIFRTRPKIYSPAERGQLVEGRCTFAFHVRCTCTSSYCSAQMHLHLPLLLRMGAPLLSMLDAPAPPPIAPHRCAFALHMGVPSPCTSDAAWMCLCRGTLDIPGNLVGHPLDVPPQFIGMSHLLANPRWDIPFGWEIPNGTFRLGGISHFNISNDVGHPTFIY